MSDVVKLFDSLANHFEHNDWDYTRKSGIEDVKYSKDHEEKEKLSFRLKMAFRWAVQDISFLNQLEPSVWGRLRTRIIMPIYSLKRIKSVPDGSLDRGNIITFWEETGEYLQFVQPSVGALLANFLKEYPEHPSAKLIIDEMDRLRERFANRIENGEVV